MSFAQLMAAFVMACAVAMRATDRRIERHLRSAGATDQSRAIAVPGRTALTPLRLRRFYSAGAVGEVDGRYYIDEDGWRRFRAVRRRRALVVLGISLAALVVAWWLGWFEG